MILNSRIRNISHCPVLPEKSAPREKDSELLVMRYRTFRQEMMKKNLAAELTR
jgi:hypothetical protein